MEPQAPEYKHLLGLGLRRVSLPRSQAKGFRVIGLRVRGSVDCRSWRNSAAMTCKASQGPAVVCEKFLSLAHQERRNFKRRQHPADNRILISIIARAQTSLAFANH